MNQISFKCLPHEICRVTSPFGYRTNPVTGQKGVFHQGIDFGAKRAGVVGDRLMAVADGRIVHAQSMMNKEYGYGNFIIIEHDGFCTLYAHMLSLDFQVGTLVKAGQIIGLMGSTGASTAAHLHFEVEPRPWIGYKDYITQENGIRKYNVDPYLYIEDYRMRVLEEAKEEMELEELKKQIAELKVVRYKNIAEMPVYYQAEIKSLIDKGIIKGNDTGVLNMTEDMVRTIIIANRMDKSPK